MLAKDILSSLYGVCRILISFCRAMRQDHELCLFTGKRGAYEVGIGGCASMLANGFFMCSKSCGSASISCGNFSVGMFLCIAERTRTLMEMYGVD